MTKLKWSRADLTYFTKPIPVAERNNDWIIWAILTICGLTGIGYFVWWVVVR